MLLVLYLHKGNTTVVAAKTERIGQCQGHRCFDRLVWHIVEVTVLIRLLVVDGRWNDAGLEGIDSGNRLDSACCTQHVTGHRLGRADICLSGSFLTQSQLDSQ